MDGLAGSGPSSFNTTDEDLWDWGRLDMRTLDLGLIAGLLLLLLVVVVVVVVEEWFTAALRNERTDGTGFTANS